MPAISRIWAGSALIGAGLQPQQGKLEPGRLVSAIGLLIPQCRPGRTTKTPRLQGNLSRRSRSYGHSMGVNTPARKSALRDAHRAWASAGQAWSMAQGASRNAWVALLSPSVLDAVSAEGRQRAEELARRRAAIK